MDIGSKSKYPANKLSNFALSKFTYDGVECFSMEGFIQALKRKDHGIQIHGCTLIGLKAKRWGGGVKWWKRPENAQLFWKGIGFKCHGKTHLRIVESALRCKFTQDESCKKALLSTTGQLTHSIGRDDNTSLKASDFCKILMKLREELR